MSGDEQPSGLREQLTLLAFGVVARWGFTVAGKAMEWAIAKWARRAAPKARPAAPADSSGEHEAGDLSG